MALVNAVGVVISQHPSTIGWAQSKMDEREVVLYKPAASILKDLFANRPVRA